MKNHNFVYTNQSQLKAEIEKCHIEDLENKTIQVLASNINQKNIQDIKAIFPKSKMIVESLPINETVVTIYDKNFFIEEQAHKLRQFKNGVDKTVLFSTTDLRGIITYANDKFAKLSGYTQEELIGKNHNVVRHPDMTKETFEDLWKTIRSGKIWEGVVKNRKKDSGHYYVKAHVMPIFNKKGEIVEYVSYREDITEEEDRRKRLEREIDLINLDSKEVKFVLSQYETALDLSSAVFRFNKTMFITYSNESFKKLYQDNPVGKQVDKIFEPEFYKKNSKEIFTKLIKKEKWQGVTKSVASDGSVFYCESTITPILNTHDEVVEYMGTFNDITEILMSKKEIEETQKDIILTMAEIGEKRSKETGNHVRRVAEISKLFALKCGLSEKEAKLIKYASPMHDIGKVAIADSILNKPSALTEDEFRAMTEHSILGYNMLKNSKREILQAAAIIAKEHHEKYDGTGYPDGLKGKEIHLYGRITAIVDVFDALGNDRVYKEAWEVEQVLEHLQKERGKHFDPELIDIFFENIDEFLAIKEELKDI